MVTEIDVYRWMLKALNSTNVKIFSIDEITIGEVSDPCLKRAYLQRIKAAAPTPIEFLRIVGNDVHLKLQDVLKEEGYQIEVGVKIKIGEFKLVGRIDALKEDGENPHLIEFKTVQEIPQEPYEPHVLQVQAYLLMTGFEKGIWSTWRGRMEG